MKKINKSKEVNVPINAITWFVVTISIIHNRWPQLEEKAFLYIILGCLAIDYGTRIYRRFQKDYRTIDDNFQVNHKNLENIQHVSIRMIAMLVLYLWIIHDRWPELEEKAFLYIMLSFIAVDYTIRISRRIQRKRRNVDDSAPNP